MYVSVDNGDRISLGIDTPDSGNNCNRLRGGGLYEFASIHFGSPPARLWARILFATILSRSKSARRCNRTKCQLRSALNSWREQPSIQPFASQGRQRVTLAITGRTAITV